MTGSTSTRTTRSTQKLRIERTLALSTRRLRPVERTLLWLVGTNETPEAPAEFDQYELARKLKRDRSTVSTMVRRLENEGLLATNRKRQPDGRWGGLVYRLPVDWERHMVIGPKTPHGERAPNPANQAANATKTPHGDWGENATTTVGQRPTTARSYVPGRRLKRLLRPFSRRANDVLDCAAIDPSTVRTSHRTKPPQSRWRVP